MALGFMTPTPKFRRTFIKRLEECLAEAKSYIDARRDPTLDASG